MEGEVERCKRELDRALSLDPNLRQGWLNRSAIAIAEKRYGDAFADLLKAEALDPNAPDNALNQGAVLLLDGKLELAAERFRRYLSLLPRSAEARFLVAKNYALAGYESLCLEQLENAIALEERMRARARTDPAFASLTNSPRFQELLETDRFTPPAGSFFLARTFRVPWQGSDSQLLIATLNAIQRLGWKLEPQVEVASSWALLWSEMRVKLRARGSSETVLELTGLREQYPNEEAFSRRAAQLFSTVELELLRMERSTRLGSR
jgi:tetratricopeptide (TPR) repeat protein